MARFTLLFAFLSVIVGTGDASGTCAPGTEGGTCEGQTDSASLPGQTDSASLLQGRFRVNTRSLGDEAAEMSEAHEMQGGCDQDSDTNCCFTQAGADFALQNGAVSAGTKAGMCATGAKELYPDRWTGFLSAKYVVVCSGDECTNKSPEGDKAAGLGHVPASGNCSDFKCPAPTMLPKKNVSKDAACTEVTECEFNCCYVDINADKKKRNEILTLATMMALKNVTAIASDLDEELGREGVNHSLGEDVNRLKMNVEGLYRTMYKVLGAPEARKYCPGGDISSIKTCTHNVLCVIEKNLDPKGAEAMSKKELKTYTLLMELYEKFQDLTWDRMVVALGNKTKGKNFDKVGEAELACSGLSGALKNLSSNNSFLATDTEEQEAAYRVSAALVDAARTTHDVLDSHKANSSVDETVAALHSAWQVPCEMLDCDHTNYWDLFGASHRHSLALIESGASGRHMRVHVGVRTRLEHRMQTFLGDYGGIFADRIMNTEGTATEAHVRAYVDVLCDSAVQTWTEHPKKYGVNSLLLSLVPREQLRSHAKTALQEQAVRAVLDDRLMMMSMNKATLRKRMQEKGLSVPDELDEEDDAPLSVVERSSLLDRSLSRKGVKKALEKGAKVVAKVAEKAVDVVVKVATVVVENTVETFTAMGEAIVTVATAIGEVVSAFVDFIISLAECLGFAAVGTIGYAKGFPPGLVPINKYVKIQVAIAVQGGLDAILNGRANGAMNIAITLGVVVGAVIGSGATGISVGLGLSAGFACGVNSNGAGHCSFTLGLGATASAAVTKMMDPRCPFGKPEAGIPTWAMTFMGFKCSVSYGVTVKLLCCAFNLMTGCQSCGTGGCKDDTTGPGCAAGADEVLQDTINTGGAKAIACDEEMVNNGYGSGGGYRGCQSYTRSGRSCQNWAAQKPHSHQKCTKTTVNLEGGGHGNIQVGSKIALRGGHKQKWCMDLNADRIRCTRNYYGQWETFEIGDGGSGKIALKGGAHNRWCIDMPNGMRCNQNWVGSWEKFEVLQNPSCVGHDCVTGTDVIAIKGSRAGKWCADEWNRIVCNRNSPSGAWEKFKVHVITPAVAEKWCASGNDQNKGLGEHNMCRNPGWRPYRGYSESYSSIWCYTTDPNKKWEYCNPLPGGTPRRRRSRRRQDYFWNLCWEECFPDCWEC